VVDLDPALGEELFDVAVGQAEAQVPADREDDDIRWEAEAGKGGPRGSRARAAGSHTSSLPATTRSPRMQQCPPKTAGIHVSRILAKLGVAGRGEAAAVAHRLGFGK
jgi:hypothetical protein